MSNQLTALDLELWEAETQALLEERSIFMDLATMRDANGVAIIHNPYYTRGVVSDYTVGTDMVSNDIVSVADDMDTFTTKYYTFVYDEVNSLDTEYSVVMSQKEIAAYQLSMEMEKAFFEEYVNAAHTATDTTLSSTNTLNTFATGNATLTSIGVDDRKIVTVVDDFTLVDIMDYVTTNGFQVADETIKRGYKGEFAWNPLYKSSSIISTATLTPAANIVAGSTYTINGVVFTARAIPAVAWEFDIGANLEATLVILTNAINGSATGKDSATGYFEVSASDRELLTGISATSTATALTVSMRWPRAVSSSTNKFGAVVSNCLIMEKGAIDFALRSPVKLISEKIQSQLAYRYSAWCNYGKKTFVQKAKRIYVVPVVRTAAEA